jgi:hypothetical protein
MKKGKRPTTKDIVPKVEINSKSPYEPLCVATSRNESTTSFRKKLEADSTTRFQHIDDGLIPFKYTISGITTNSSINVRDAVILCQKAYYNFAIFRNTIDLMTEFSATSVFFRHGSKKSRDFFSALFKKLDINGIQDRFYREYFRSGNVFIYRFDGKVQEDDLRKLSQVFGIEVRAATLTLPIRYIILNPADISVGGNISFMAPIYYKILSDYELERLRKPLTSEDKEVFDGLDPKIKEQINNKGNKIILLPLDFGKTAAIFYKKQDYEPFSVPMGFPVLDDINFKAEMKKMDLAAMRTMQQIILVVTMGAEPDKGGVNQAHLLAMQKFFETESVARVLIADYTTKVSFAIPDIANLLDPKKYTQVDKDIKEGLNNLLISSEDKYANANMKITVFLERLKQARESFKNQFLIPEIKRIAKEAGLKNYPEPFFEEIDFKDELELAKIYTRLAELGILTPEETFEAFENGRLPTNEESLESQEKFKGFKDKGLYQPIVGGPANQMEMQERQLEHDDRQQKAQLKHEAENPPPKPPNIGQPKKPKGQSGRPSGTKSKQSTKKVGPIGASGFSLAKIKDILGLIDDLEAETERAFKKKFGTKELNDEQKNNVKEVADIIIANEEYVDWKNKINSYIENPLDTNQERVSKITDIAIEHGLDMRLASILYLSKVGNA